MELRKKSFFVGFPTIKLDIMNFKGIQAISLVVFVTFTTFVQGQFNRRDEIIGDWVRRIREGPKGHSMSPSWSSKSRIPAIGVGDLPLQNEADDSSYQTNDIQINRIQAAGRSKLKNFVLRQNKIFLKKLETFKSFKNQSFLNHMVFKVISWNAKYK